MTIPVAKLKSPFQARTGLIIGLGIIAFFLIMAVVAPFLAPYSATSQELLDALKPPSAAHLFGTDALGRDILSRIMFGASFEMIVVIPAVAVSFLIALPAGLLAGYRGGWVDRTISSISDSVLTFPAMVLAIVLVAVLGSGMLPLMLAIVATQTPQMVRYIRGFTGQVRSADYIMAARASGSRAFVVLARHILPNILGPIMVILSLFASEALLIIAALGFLGIGVQPPTPEWGTMLSEGRADFQSSPHVMIFPGLFIALLILGFNLLGDGLRDVLDKRNN
jgi:peptide/nickel transport system permease protein